MTVIGAAAPVASAAPPNPSRTEVDGRLDLRTQRHIHKLRRGEWWTTVEELDCTGDEASTIDKCILVGGHKGAMPTRMDRFQKTGWLTSRGSRP